MYNLTIQYKKNGIDGFDRLEADFVDLADAQQCAQSTLDQIVEGVKLNWSETSKGLEAYYVGTDTGFLIEEAPDEHQRDGFIEDFEEFLNDLG